MSSNKKSTVQKRPGTVDKGKEFEFYNIANFALHLVTDNTIQEFSVSADDVNFGAFDDVILEITNENGNTEKYAMQLKYSGDKKNAKILFKEKGIFDINKYFKSFQECREHVSDYQLFLWTNLAFTLGEYIEVNIEGKILKLKVVKSEIPVILKQCGMRDNLHKFEIMDTQQQDNDYQKFFDCLFLCTNQMNTDQLKTNILTKMKDFSFDGTGFELSFFNYLKEWEIVEKNKEKLNKKIMKEVIALLLLDSYILPIQFGDVQKQGILFQEAVSKFNVTVFEKAKLHDVVKIWGNTKLYFTDFNKRNNTKKQNQRTPKHVSKINDIRKQYQIGPKDISASEDLTDKEWSKLLWLMDVCPLVLISNRKISKAIELCPHKNFVVIGTNYEPPKDCKIFQNLSDLNGHSQLLKEMKKNLKCLVSDSEENLEQLFQQDPDFECLVTTDELLQMIDETYVIHEKEEELPFPCIDRFLSKNIIDFKYLETVDEKTLIVISELKNKEEISRYIQKKNFTESLDEDLSRKSNIFLVEKEVSVKEFEEVCGRNRKMKRYHHFTVKEGKLEWFKSIGDILDLNQFRINTDFEAETSLSNISKFQNNVVIITDEPGKGKSVLLKNLKNSLMSKVWTILLSSAEIRDFHENYENDFENFLFNVKYPKFTDFEKHVLKIGLRNNQLVFLWDALDEVDSETLETVTNFISNHLRNNCVHFITCRLHLRSFLENKFCVLSRNIDRFNDKQQRFYIKKRLGPSCPEQNFEDLIETIKKYFEFSKPRDFLGVPIQIYMLTELLLRDKNKYFNLLKKIFSVADLYEYFIDEKLKLSYKCEDNEYTRKVFNDLKMFKSEFYQEVALMTLFGEELVSQFGINVVKINQKIQKENDIFGFIIYDENTSMSHFVHNSYAEYFAATYFAENFETITNLKNILFDVKYTNVRFFFDLLLAKNSPAHIAILHKNFKALMKFEVSDKDSGGRNILHLFCSWDERYPVLSVHEEPSNSFVYNDENVNILTENRKEYEEALDYILSICDVKEKDNVFKIDSLSYAEYGECLLTMAFIDQKVKLGHFKCKNDKISCSTLYYSICLDRPEFIDMFKDIKFFALKLGISLIHLAVQNQTEECLKKLLSLTEFRKNVNYDNGKGVTPMSLALTYRDFKSIQLLYNCGGITRDQPKSLINKDDIKIEHLPLHNAVLGGQENIVQYCITQKESINAIDNDNKTPILLSCENGHYGIAELLLKNGADINIADKNGRTPLYMALLMGNNKLIELFTSINSPSLEECQVVKTSFDQEKEIFNQLLIKSRTLFSASDENRLTPLYLACVKGYKNIALSLIQSQANVNAVNENGFTPLYVACQNGHNPVVELLIRSQADIDAANKNGCTPLYTACQNGHEGIVELLIKSQADLNAADKDGFTPFHVACENGHESIVELLIKSQADVNAANKDGFTPLYVACRKGHKSVVELLIESQVGVNVADKNGITPLHVVCQNGHKSIVELLIESAADVDAADEDGFTPLYVACLNGHENVVEPLIISQADVNAVNKNGFTPLYAACQNGHKSVVELLIKYQADVNAANKNGSTPLYVACINGHENVVEPLINSQADVNATNKNGYTPLYVACQNGHVNIVEFLIKSQADVNSINNDGITSLYAACLKGHENVVELLIKCQADVNGAYKNGSTPLHVACQNGHERVVELLIKSQADLNAADEDGFTPLYVAWQNGHDRIGDLLIKAQVDVNEANKNGFTLLYVACREGNKSVVELLIKYQADVNAANKDGVTPLYVACQSGHKSVVDVLIKSQADVNAANITQVTPLHVACLNGHESVVELLIKSQANMNAADKAGLTPLHVACQNRHESIVELLIRFLADVNVADANGVTPLHVACQIGHKSVVELLIKFQANVNAADEGGITPLYVACLNGHEQIVDSLINVQADIDVADEDGVTPLYVACQNGHESVAKLLIKSKSDVNAANLYGFTPLHAASRNGHERVVDLLINSEVDVNAANKNGFTSLHVACRNGHKSIVELLIKSQANVNAADKNGLTPLDVARQIRHESIVELLIKSQADANAPNKDGFTQLHAACQIEDTIAVELLIKSGFDVNVADEYGVTPLYVACLNGYEQIVDLLIKSQADVNATDKDGVTPLYVACENGHESVAKLLIKSQADVNAANKDGFTPLHMACRFRHESVVKLLIKSQAALNATNKGGFTPLHVACQIKQESVVELLIESQADVNAADKDGFTPLHVACQEGHESVVKLLIKSEAHLNAADKNGCTPLFEACQNGHERIVVLLIKARADVNAVNKNGFTPLYVTCRNGHESVAKVLVKFQADLNAADKHGLTPLHVACRFRHESVVKLLITSQADLNAANREGDTPLHIACQKGHESVVELLINSEADVNAANNKGFTPLQVASQNKHEHVVKLIRRNLH